MAPKGATPLLGLTLLVLGLVAVVLLGLAAAPVSVLRSPAIVWLALRGRPVLGAVGFSLLSAVVILYLLTERARANDNGGSPRPASRSAGVSTYRSRHDVNVLLVLPPIVAHQRLP